MEIASGVGGPQMKAAATCIVTCLIWLLVVGASPVCAQNVITTFAGTPWIFRGDRGPALKAPLGVLQAMAVDSGGNVYVGDSSNHIVVKMSPDGILTVVAGNGFNGSSGDGGSATNASLDAPVALALDAAGNIYVGDSGNYQIRKISSSGTITTVLGYWGAACQPPAGAVHGQLWGVTVDAAGSIYFLDRTSTDARVLKIAPGCVVTKVAGGGSSTPGDGGPAVNALLKDSSGLAVDAAGNLYIADGGNARVRKVDRSGIISTVAGGGTAYPGDGGAATAAQLFEPYGLSFDGNGNLYVTDRANNNVRKVTPGGIISTVAGNGQMGYSGDGGAAAAASFHYPEIAEVDTAGNMYIADTMNHRVRKVNAAGVISTYGGNGNFKFAGDGGGYQRFLLLPD